MPRQHFNFLESKVHHHILSETGDLLSLLLRTHLVFHESNQKLILCIWTQATHQVEAV
jgi:hypothetical protein